MMSSNPLIEPNSDESHKRVPSHLKRVYELVKEKHDTEEASKPRQTPESQHIQSVQSETVGIDHRALSQDTSYSQDSLSAPNKFGSLVRIKEELIQNDESDELLTPLTAAESAQTETNQSSCFDTPTIPEIKLEKVVNDPFREESVDQQQYSNTVERQEKPSSPAESTSSGSSYTSSSSTSSSSGSDSSSSTNSGGSSSSSSSSSGNEEYDSGSGSSSGSSESTDNEDDDDSSSGESSSSTNTGSQTK
jgi:hypothetical protein